MSSERILLAARGLVHARRRTPWVAIVVITAVAIVLIGSGDLSELADTTVLLLLLVQSGRAAPARPRCAGGD